MTSIGTLEDDAGARPGSSYSGNTAYDGVLLPTTASTGSTSRLSSRPSLNSRESVLRRRRPCREGHIIMHVHENASSHPMRARQTRIYAKVDGTMLIGMDSAPVEGVCGNVLFRIDLLQYHFVEFLPHSLTEGMTRLVDKLKKNASKAKFRLSSCAGAGFQLNYNCTNNNSEAGRAGGRVNKFNLPSVPMIVFSVQKSREARAWVRALTSAMWYDSSLLRDNDQGPAELDLPDTTDVVRSEAADGCRDLASESLSTMEFICKPLSPDIAAAVDNLTIKIMLTCTTTERKGGGGKKTTLSKQNESLLLSTHTNTKKPATTKPGNNASSKGTNRLPRQRKRAKATEPGPVCHCAKILVCNTSSAAVHTVGDLCEFVQHSAGIPVALQRFMYYSHQAAGDVFSLPSLKPSTPLRTWLERHCDSDTKQVVLALRVPHWTTESLNCSIVQMDRVKWTSRICREGVLGQRPLKPLPDLTGHGHKKEGRATLASGKKLSVKPGELHKSESSATVATTNTNTNRASHLSVGARGPGSSLAMETSGMRSDGKGTSGERDANESVGSATAGGQAGKIGKMPLRPLPVGSNRSMKKLQK